MPKITRLEQQKKNKERVNVYLDDEFAFGLNLMDAASLTTGQELTQAQIDELKEKDSTAKAMDKAVNLLAYRPRSTQEIRRRLQKKYSEDTTEQVIEKLNSMGYLDDRAFAKLYIQDRNRLKPRGKRALSYELRRKGIASHIIDELLDDMVDELDGAYQAAQKRVRRMRGKTQAEFKKKVGAFLQRRGFNYDVTRRVLDQLIEETNEEDPDFFAEDENGWYN